jgi:hypothetical protein
VRSSEELVQTIQSHYNLLPDAFKEKVIRFILVNMPKGKKLKDIMGYSRNTPTFDLDFANGDIAVYGLLQMILSGKYEVKRDYRISETKKAAIEVACKGKPSGLSTTDAAWWIQFFSGPEYNDELAVMSTVRRLRKIVNIWGYEVPGGDNNAAINRVVNKNYLLAPSSQIEERSLQPRLF